MCTLTQKLYNTRHAFTESRRTISWIWYDLLDKTGRTRGVHSVALLMVSTLILLGGTYATKEVVDAIAAGNQQKAMYWILIGAGGMHFVSRWVMAWHAYKRELAWNDNHFHIRVRLNALFFDRTMGELITEETDIGPEQIEAAQNRIDALLHLLLFNVAPAVVTSVTSVILMTSVDMAASLFMILLLGFNILWFLYYNETISTKMEPVDKEFRRISNRMGEYWTQFQSTKTSGVEDKVCGHVANELKDVLHKDRAIWADWFIWLDVRRSLVNIAGFVGIMLYGVQYAAWSPGDFAAITIWMAMVGEKFSVVGTLMRYLTEYTTRLKAIRDALTKPPAFDRLTGTTYIPNGGTDAHKT